MALTSRNEINDVTNLWDKIADALGLECVSFDGYKSANFHVSGVGASKPDPFVIKIQTRPKRSDEGVAALNLLVDAIDDVADEDEDDDQRSVDAA